MFALLSFLFRLVLALLVVRLIVRGVASVVAPRRPAPARTSDVDLVRDRVCNTFLPRTRAVVAVVEGHEEHFCSPTCAQRALAQAAGTA